MAEIWLSCWWQFAQRSEFIKLMDNRNVIAQHQWCLVYLMIYSRYNWVILILQDKIKYKLQFVQNSDRNVKSTGQIQRQEIEKIKKCHIPPQGHTWLKWEIILCNMASFTDLCLAKVAFHVVFLKCTVQTLLCHTNYQMMWLFISGLCYHLSDAII